MASIERRFRNDVARLEHAGGWGFRVGDRVQLTAAGEMALLPRSTLASTRGAVCGTLAWRTEAGVRREAVAAARGADDDPPAAAPRMSGAGIEKP